MESGSKVVEKNIKHIITSSQVEQIEENTAALQETIESITQSINEVKNNPSKIYDITEAIKKTTAN